MRKLVLVVVAMFLGACQCGGSSQQDAGSGGGNGGSGGSSGGSGGGSGGGGGGNPRDGGGLYRLDPAAFDAGYVDDGGISSECEVDALAPVAADCAPATTGCHTAADCPSGICLQLVSGGVCTRACSDDSQCDVGWSCRRRWTGAGQQGFCAPEGRVP